MNIIKRKSGFTMIELLVAVAIVAILILILMFVMRNQNARGYDARRKADLENIKIAFEDYYNDNDCYPEMDALNVCGDESLKPYLNSIPCDPISGDPYSYEPVPGCIGYRAYAVLQDEKDPVIEKLGCNTEGGCGAAAGPEYNYGFAIGVPFTTSSDIKGSTTPGPIWVFACDSSGICNKFEEGHSLLSSCPVTYEETNCQNACGNINNRCTGF